MRNLAVLFVILFIAIIVMAQIKFENTSKKIVGMSKGHSLYVLKKAGYDVENVGDKVTVDMKVKALFYGD
jgi:hypothetical protein